MSRATNAPARKQRKKKVFKRASGFYGMGKSSYRVAASQVRRAMAYAYVGRKVKKRDYRSLWNVRINAGARQNGTTYSKLIKALADKNVLLDRRVLADIALHDPAGFTKIVELARG